MLMVPTFMTQSMVAQVLLALLVTSAVFMLGFAWKIAGIMILALGLVGVIYAGPANRSTFLAVYLSLGILCLTPISPALTITSVVFMGSGLTAALIVPYLVTRLGLGAPLQPLWWPRPEWSWHMAGIILAAGLVSWVIFPFYFWQVGNAGNWALPLELGAGISLLAGLLIVGVWEQLFFVGTILPLLQRLIPFSWANLVQSAFFALFLFAIGFSSWGLLIAFGFALCQGWITYHFRSVPLALLQHAVVDVVLFVSLLQAQYPVQFSQWLSG
jgi:membrane protease YdiL (CAAX protease family)